MSTRDPSLFAKRKRERLWFNLFDGGHVDWYAVLALDFGNPFMERIFCYQPIVIFGKHASAWFRGWWFGKPHRWKLNDGIFLCIL